MASVVLFVNQKGEEVVSRSYRGDVSRSSIDAFRRKIIASKSTGQHNPVVMVEGTTFMFVKHMNLFLVAATRSSPNVVLIFEYLFQKLRILKSYIGDKFTDDTLKANFTLVYELFDETMDYGYPQNCAVDVLQLYINQGSIMDMARAGNSGTALTSQITGAIDWRRDGLRYRKNEVFIDVHETVTLLTSSNGNVLRAEIHGKVMMKTQLTGMPECKFGLNDKLIMEKEGGAYGGDKGQAGVEIDDCTFHRLVFSPAPLTLPSLLSTCIQLNPRAYAHTLSFYPLLSLSLTHSLSETTDASAWASSTQSAPSPSSLPTASSS